MKGKERWIVLSVDAMIILKRVIKNKFGICDMDSCIEWLWVVGDKYPE
jgi:hypothetical protein